jgi:hypothetical protein
MWIGAYTANIHGSDPESGKEKLTGIILTEAAI